MSLEEAKKRIQEARENNSKRLNLRSLKLKEIPPEISELTQLTSLALSENLLECFHIERKFKTFGTKINDQFKNKSYC